MTKKVLFVFWHGIGDNILATPAIKKYKQKTNNYVGWMMMEKLRPAQLFKQNPYIDKLHWCSDAWHCVEPENVKAGSVVVKQEAEAIAEQEGYDDIIVVTHWDKTHYHKIHRTAAEMGVLIEDNEVKTEFIYSEQDIQSFYKKIDLPEEFVFFNGKTGSASGDKDWPLEWIKQYMYQNQIDLPIISPDFTWNINEVPIGFAADVMKKAKFRFLVDSGLYHIAHALDLPIDLAYFKRGQPVWEQVKPLHSIEEKIIYEL